MQAKKINNTSWIIRIDRGENIIESLNFFSKTNNISGGFFFGLGACDRVELAHYNVEKKKYSTEKFNKAFEIASINGSIGKEEDIIIHAHVVLADEKTTTYAGHLIEGRVSGTAEIHLTAMPELKKKHDHETGLKLFDLS